MKLLESTDKYKIIIAKNAITKNRNPMNILKLFSMFLRRFIMKWCSCDFKVTVFILFLLIQVSVAGVQEHTIEKLGSCLTYTFIADLCNNSRRNY